MEDKELLQPWLAPDQPQVSGAVCAALYSVSHHSFEISHCNFGPEVIATTSVIPMSPGHNLRIHVRTLLCSIMYCLPAAGGGVVGGVGGVGGSTLVE